MRRQVRCLAGLVGAAALVLGGCAGDGSESASQPSSSPAWSVGVVPTAEQLASVLVTADDHDGIVASAALVTNGGEIHVGGGSGRWRL